jgi:hypothetical protein
VTHEQCKDYVTLLFVLYLRPEYESSVNDFLGKAVENQFERNFLIPILTLSLLLMVCMDLEKQYDGLFFIYDFREEVVGT